MTTFLTDLVANVFRPSFAALSIAIAVAIVTIDGNAHKVSMDRVDVTDLSCGGLFKPFCRLTY